MLDIDQSDYGALVEFIYVLLGLEIWNDQIMLFIYIFDNFQRNGIKNLFHRLFSSFFNQSLVFESLITLN